MMAKKKAEKDEAKTLADLWRTGKALIAGQWVHCIICPDEHRVAVIDERKRASLLAQYTYHDGDDPEVFKLGCYRPAYVGGQGHRMMHTAHLQANGRLLIEEDPPWNRPQPSRKRRRPPKRSEKSPRRAPPRRRT